jgi:hypothetical protein
MTKGKSFMDKLAKSTHDYGTHCPECGEVLTTVKMVVSELSEETGAWKFNQKFVKKCKCNEEELIH